MELSGVRVSETMKGDNTDRGGGDMVRAKTEQDFWSRVERRMRLKNPYYYGFMSWLLRVGMIVVLLAAAYVVMGWALSPPQGYFLTSLELSLHPIIWVLAGVFLIIAGAILRFRAMGPIIEEMNANPDL